MSHGQIDRQYDLATQPATYVTSSQNDMGRLQALYDLLFGASRPDKAPRIRKDGRMQHATDSFPFLNLPPEIQEKILEQALLDENVMAWEWSGEFFGQSSHLGLLPRGMQPPALARLSRQLRVDVLAYLFRTTTFRIEPNLQEISLLHSELAPHGTRTAVIDHALFSERLRTMTWLRLLDGRQEGGIRRLQFRPSIPDCTGKKASLNLHYMTEPRRWHVELVPDSGFKSADSKHYASLTGPAPPKPIEYETKILRKLLIAEARDRNGEKHGLEWAAISRLIRIVSLWFIVNRTHFRYQGFRDTVAIPARERGERRTKLKASTAALLDAMPSAMP